MATTFNDALQLFNIGTSTTTNINDGNIIIPEGSETLSDLIKLNYDFKDTPLIPEVRSYNIYLWNNNTDGEIRFYTKDAKNNNDFNKDYFSGNYSEPRLNFNTKIGKDGKLYFWHNYSIKNPSKLSGWYEIADNISSMETQLTFLDGLTAGLSASIVITNNNISLLAARVSVVENAIVLITTDINMIGDDVIGLRRSTQSIWDYMDFNNNPTIQNRLAEYIEAIQPYNLTQGLFDEVNQLVRIQASSALSAYRINLANNFGTVIAGAVFSGAVLGAIKYIADTQQRDNYSTELIRITDTLAKRTISSANNTLIHTGITRISGAGDFPITNNEFYITIQKEAVLIIGIDIDGIANILLVDQIGNQPFNVNESITINRTLLNGSAGNLTLNVASLGTLKQWTELKATYLKDKINKIDTKTRRKANVIGYDDINPFHFTKAPAIYTDYNGSDSETIVYKTLEINANYKPTNAETADIAVKLQTPRKIANVNFDGSADISLSYNDLTDKPTTFSGNIGIGTVASASYNLDIYNQSTSRIRLQSSSDYGATTSIEFRKGVVPDVWSDYRLINDNSTFKLQYENADFPYSNDNNIMTWNRIDAVNYIQTRFNANVGINTDPHATYKLDVNGTVNTTAVRGNGAELTDLNAGNITTGTINLDRITLTAAKLYQSFNTTNFAVIDNKIDLPPNYSFTITGYDSQTLFNPSADRKYKGKMSCSYDDRNGVHKILTEENKTTNVAVLQYKVGDKITIRNTADPKLDYLLYDGFKYFNSLYLVKRPISQPVSWTNVAWQPHIYEWRSGDGLDGRPDAYIYKPGEIQVHTFTTPVSVVIETGFNYYLFKTYNEVDYDQYGTIFINASGYGDDFDDFNRAFGAGQTFKLQAGTGFLNTEYIPTAYIAADISVASDRRVGVVKPRARVSVDASGNLDADIPTSTDLITNMNTTHFTNNTGTSKIDISSSYVAPNATKLATARNIAGVSFDGTGNIDIPYSGLTSVPTTWSVSQIPDLGAGKITSGTFADARIPDLGAGKITSGTFADARIPDLGTGKITSGTFADARIPSLDTGKITTGTFADARIPNLDTGKITTGTFADARIPSLDTGKITTGTFADARIPNLDTGKITTGTFADARIPSLAISKITGLQTALDGKAPTSHTHAITDITNLQTTLDGKASTSHTHTIANVSGLQTALDGKQATLTSTNTIGIFNTTQFENVNSLIQIKSSVLGGGGLWQTGTPSNNIYYSAGNVSMGATGRTTNVIGRFQLNNENNQEYSSFDIVSASSPDQSILATFRRSDMITGLSLTSDMNNVNFNAFGTNTNIGTVIRTKGIGNFGLETNATSRITVIGNTGNVGIGTTDPQTKLHINDASLNTTTLTIQNNFTPSIPTEISVVGAASIIIGTIERCISFPYSGTGTTRDYTFTTTENLICDILVVGGGGAGGNSIGGGGGAGGVVYTINQTLTTGTYTVKVGRGGIGTIHPGGDGQGSVGIDQDGVDSFIQLNSTDVIFPMEGVNQSLRGKGGGGGGVYYAPATVPGRPGGSGGGAAERENAVYNGGISTQGNTYWNGSSYVVGGSSGYGNLTSDGNYFAPGGGGAGNTQFNNIYNGKTGVQISITGTPLFYAAGGGGGQHFSSDLTRGLGGSSIGGNGRVWSGSSFLRDPTPGAAGTGSGGGGNAYLDAPNLAAGSGGSGIVIIRYRRIPTQSSSIELLRGTTTDVNHDWKLGNYEGDFKIKKSVDNVETDALIIYKNQVSGRDVFYLPDGDLNIEGTTYTGAISSTNNIIAGGYLQGSGAGGGFRIVRPDSWVRLRNTADTAHLDFVVSQLYADNLITAANGINVSGVANLYSTLNVSGATIMGGQLRVQGNNLVINGSMPTIFFRDSDQRQGMIHINSGLMYFLSGPASNSSDSATDWAANYGEWPLVLNLNTNEARFGGEITATFKAVSATDTDHLVVQLNYGAIGDASTLRIKVGFGTFTGFHRCYTDDELYNNETDENIETEGTARLTRADIFKNKYVGRIVIASGKIKTDFTRKKAREPVEEVVEPPIEEEDEWYSEIDKDGITIEDAVPVVRLSRQRKDKRVFGVLGAPKRNTNNKDRLIVNSVGEGAICVSNTNGNIENGDLLQSSDLLGYAEKQDDDIIRSYTIGKATIDCNFELDSPYYQCHEIENGVRVAFIACSYCCG
jgi:hypothetical protein